ncbi:2-oxo-4-hydroxy-4-carboxy-5-ureidoimidazoline decarboxylase [uncultured Jatrophihabitans sp.]|uniref:2-oxo-4-hydroxy-4-carboxy-5-ureidoimidazoline decarboxylase n=1 Tax=uncultured Jatrophihabitans sp. TaxID=1610747 RepID=UPI0035CAD769
MTEPVLDVAAFDALPADVAGDLLRPACASAAWLAAVVARRPYADVHELWAASDEVLSALPWTEIEQAMAAHARIGERAGGAEREAAWSREEQAGAATSGTDSAAALHRGNLAYERRFGHVFLICATGRSAEQLLAALHERLDNDADTEQHVVRTELAAIVRLRIARVLA